MGERIFCLSHNIHQITAVVNNERSVTADIFYFPVLMSLIVTNLIDNNSGEHGTVSSSCFTGRGANVTGNGLNGYPKKRLPGWVLRSATDRG